MNADIQIETVGSYDISQNLYVYNSTLYLKNVTLTPSIYLCEINDKFKEISLTIKGKRFLQAILIIIKMTCSSLRVMNPFQFNFNSKK